MLVPDDYAENNSALFHPLTRQLMARIDFQHGGPDFDRRYPDGIPTTVDIKHGTLGALSSGLVMYPQGHARADATQLAALVNVGLVLALLAAFASVAFVIGGARTDVGGS